MKRIGLWSFVMGLAATSLSAQIVITSLNQNGELAWTNSVSNATYRVEWANSLTGAWQQLDALTNLSSIEAASNHVTVQVPMFYRVVWADAPAYAGTWDYSAFDTNNTLVATGRLDLLPVGSSTSTQITGTWAIQRAGDTNYDVGPQIGTGELAGSLVTTNQMVLNLNPGFNDYGVGLDGEIGDTNYEGNWHIQSFAGPRVGGKFDAVKRAVR